MVKIKSGTKADNTVQTDQASMRSWVPILNASFFYRVDLVDRRDFYDGEMIAKGRIYDANL